MVNGAFDTDPKSMRIYSHHKLLLADLLRDGIRLSGHLGQEDAGDALRELMARLAEDRFVLAVAGAFNRGKSTLMNSLIGRPLLPTGIVPLTSVVTVLRYGSRERALAETAGGLFPEEHALSELAELVTRRGNPDNVRRLAAVYVETPSPFLRHGLEFVDTPGVGSMRPSGASETYGFLPGCDAVVFVTAADAAMSEADASLLRTLHRHGHRFFVVLNKIDLVPEDHRRELIEFVTGAVQECLGEMPAGIFSVSAINGLLAKQSGDRGLFSASGLEALENRLTHFLSTEKAQVFLRGIAARASRILRNGTPFPHEAAGLSGEGRRDAAEWRALTEKLETFMESQEAKHKKEIVTGREENTPYVAVVSGRQAAPEEDSGVSVDQAVDLRSDMACGGCPACHYLTRVTADFFAAWQFGLATEASLRVRFARHTGFCPLHTWQLLALSSPYGASIGYAPLVETVAETLGRPPDRDGPDRRLEELLQASVRCEACAFQKKALADYWLAFSDLIGRPDGREKYLHSQGLCLRHMEALCKTGLVPAELVGLLREALADRLRTDADAMRRYALKRDALKRSLIRDEEKYAYRRAIVRIFSDKAIDVPWEEDGEIG